MKRSILTLLCILMSFVVFAQSKIDIAGIIIDESGQELIGVTVRVKGRPGALHQILMVGLKYQRFPLAVLLFLVM